MNPWERRLRDLAQLLKNCHTTYLDPDLFRMNTNQFLQTARTITFIIQKNKATIPDYDRWYAAAVINGWKGDLVMQWAKEARNSVEKEGDLELHSSLKATLLFSYLVEQDVVLECGRDELLAGNVKKLVRLGRSNLPTGVSDAAAVKIERRWVTATLSSWELLQALSYVYARMLACCRKLATHLGKAIDSSIPDANHFDRISDETRQVRFVKLKGMHMHSVATESVAIDRSMEIPPSIRATFNDSQEHPRPQIASLDAALDYYKRMAEATFLHYGNHAFMLFILGDEWQPIDMLSTQFEDQTDKFIFWRSVADRITNLKATGIVWIGESWLRKADRSTAVAVRNLPIAGERLTVLGIDRTGAQAQHAWNILRPSKTDRPVLESIREEDEFNNEERFFLVPVLRAFGLPDPDFVPRRSAG
ncbi:MAG: hypothetical protein H0W40_11625 [Methylibium sp.]|uniref:hypothetical protein n=1 Tax=Methylibium sp. TaxID=2067992 RepID=UPI00182DC076|nr:hypothetical protein [Methylibium sp.]MBA3598007.1 hypothetical protein [Methylibium sp.]